MMAEFVSTVIRNADELEERARLNEALRTQGEVVQNMQTALMVWAPDEESGSFRLDYANAATETVIGLSPAEIVGLTLHEVLPAIPDWVEGCSGASPRPASRSTSARSSTRTTGSGRASSRRRSFRCPRGASP